MASALSSTAAVSSSWAWPSDRSGGALAHSRPTAAHPAKSVRGAGFLSFSSDNGGDSSLGGRRRRGRRRTTRAGAAAAATTAAASQQGQQSAAQARHEGNATVVTPSSASGPNPSPQQQQAVVAAAPPPPPPPPPPPHRDWAKALSTMSQLLSPLLALASIVFTYCGQQDSLKLQRQLDAEKERMERALSRKEEEEELLNRFRDPLLWATADLQNRLYAIVESSLLVKYCGPKARRGGGGGGGGDGPSAGDGVDVCDDCEYMISYTLYLLAQLFGWMEIVRKDERFLDLRRSVTRKEVNQAFAKAIENIEYNFLSETLNPLFCVYQGQQRAIGEIMLTRKEEQITGILGYAEFSVRMSSDDQFARWFSKLRRDIERAASLPESHPLSQRQLERLTRVQWALIELLDLLDPKMQVVPQERRMFVTEQQLDEDEIGSVMSEVPRAPTPTQVQKTASSTNNELLHADSTQVNGVKADNPVWVAAKLVEAVVSETERDAGGGGKNTNTTTSSNSSSVVSSSGAVIHDDDDEDFWLLKRDEETQLSDESHLLKDESEWQAENDKLAHAVADASYK